MKKIALISLMAAAVALTSTSALARDHRNNDGDRDYRGDNHNERSYDSHSGRQSGRH